VIKLRARHVRVEERGMGGMKGKIRDKEEMLFVNAVLPSGP